MALNGVNKLCKGCGKECKQYKQVKVIRCPYYQRKDDRSEELQNSSIAKSEISSRLSDFLQNELSYAF